MITAALISLLVSVPGYPGPECRADYTISVSLDEGKAMLTGSVEILFTSGVPFPVDTLWLHLYPNAYRDHTTAFGRDLEAVGRYGLRSSPESQRGWIDLLDWSAGGDPVTPEVDGTLAFIPLDEPLLPGDSILLGGGFSVHVPRFWSRMGHVGENWQITQWYPKMCVLDDRGWHLGRYRWRGEFFSDFGDYSVTLELPGDYVTAATGRIDTLFFAPDSLRRTETWKAFEVHDFAWAASPWYTMREHTFIYPDSLGGRSVRVHLVLLYDDEEHWEEVPAIVDSTLLYYGDWYAPYPYMDLWVVEPVVLSAGGMEYPQLIFSAAEFPILRVLEVVTSHEVGHQWFYGMLGNDEVDEAWLDEGMNSFSELRYMERKHGFSGNYSTTPDWILELSDLEMQQYTYSAGVGGGERFPVLSDATGAGDGSYSMGFTYYAKPAQFMRMLQSQMGPYAFDRVMDIYFQRFTFHHPHTDDFQAVVEEVTGRSWQVEFDYWLRGTGSADLLVSALDREAGSTTVVVEGEIPHPLDAEVLFVCGEDSLLLISTLTPGEPCDTITASGDWCRAVVDPFGRLPDRAPWNNSMPAMSQLKPLLLPLPRPTHISTWIVGFPSYADGSWRMDVASMSSPLPSFLGGPWTWTAGLSIPFSSGSSSYWGTSFHMPLHRDLDRRLYLKTSLSRGWGLGSASAELGLTMPGRVPTDPRAVVSAGLELSSIEDTRVMGAANVEEGSGVEFSAGLGYSDENYRLSLFGNAGLLVSPGWSGDAPYMRADLELQTTLRLTGSMLARTRLYAGRVTGGAPMQRRLRPGGGLFPKGGLLSTLLPPDGPLSPREHYFARTGPALPGYIGLEYAGRASLTMEQRLPLPLPFLEPELFFGAGWVEDGFGDFDSDNLLSNAGLILRFAILEALFPVWVSDPVEGESQWEFRWRLGLSPWGMPDLY